jgi:hypothetical protein
MNIDELILMALLINILIKFVVWIKSFNAPKPLTSTFFIMFMFDKHEEIKDILDKKNYELKKELLKDALDKYLLTKDKLNEIKKSNEKNK